ncbi:unnamed protein product [Triticum turgidum subsp. durum]|uniref:Amine oxidase domain-containing protein n=1 Tax=Triticum turgidum subsp. durum TaxID=4567 RepID=A0A9R1A5L1_TRITD|nr:unnamed protein product [Triticum turgidum subsp. durum]
MKLSFVTAISALVLLAAQHASLAAAGRGPRVIIVGAGMSGISAGKRLWDAGVRDLLILEAMERVGGRMHKHNFGGLNVEIGANWVEGLNGDKVNPIWPMVNASLKLRNFYSDFDGVVGNVYKESGGLYDEEFVQKRMDRGDEVEELGGKLAAKMDPSGRDDMSILAMQRLFNHQPNGPATPVDMVLDYFRYDYEFAEPPRVTSLQGTEPTATFADFGDDAHFVADQRGFETLIYHIAGQYLRSDKSGNIVDPRVKLNKVVREISYNQRGVVVTTEDNSAYSADYVIVSASIGVLQSDLIQFKPQLPAWKIFAIYRFDMFPDRDVPDATDIYVPRWWSNRFFKGSYSNWPVGVNRYEYDQLRAPVGGRVYFTGEHTSEHYNGYVHGAYLAGIDSADILINKVLNNVEFKVRPKYDDEQKAEAK